MYHGVQVGHHGRAQKYDHPPLVKVHHLTWQHRHTSVHHLTWQHRHTSVHHLTWQHRRGSTQPSAALPNFRLPPLFGFRHVAPPLSRRFFSLMMRSSSKSSTMPLVLTLLSRARSRDGASIETSSKMLLVFFRICNARRLSVRYRECSVAFRKTKETIKSANPVFRKATGHSVFL